MVEIAMTFLVGVLAGGIGALAGGGGGLLSIPFLIFTGLPPITAIATNRLGALGLVLSSAYKFLTTDLIQWRYLLLLTFLASIGSIIGMNLLIQTPDEYIEIIIGLILLGLIPFLISQKHRGIQQHVTSTFQKIIGFILYFFIMIFGGFFGGGAGVLLVTSQLYAFGFTFLQANATNAIPWVFVTTITLVFFYYHGLVETPIGLALFSGMVIGGYAGAHMAVAQGNLVVKRFFVIIVAASALKLLFF